MMVRLRVNGTEVLVNEGASLLDAARAAGFDVPTLCYLKKTGALTACMVCVVRDLATGRTLPSCAARAEEGMDIATEDDGLRAARREALSLILNEHAGDCEGPCARICPAGLNVPRMLRLLQAGEVGAAARMARRDLVFPATLGRVCTAPCERVCRRTQYDGAVAIRTSHGIAAETFLDAPVEPGFCAAPTGKSAAVVGAGLAGLAAARELVRRGHACRVYEKQGGACAGLRAVSPEKLPTAVLDAEIAAVLALGVEARFNCAVGADLSLDDLLQEHDAVIIACGMAAPRDPRVFTAVEEPLHVRAVGSGKRAAAHADAWLSDRPAPVDKPFNSMLGRLEEAELADYAVERRLPEAEGPDGLVREAARCLHCDCLKLASCKLRRHAEDHGLGPQMKRTLPRPAVSPILRAGRVLFEPGKCIRCGICVALTAASEGPGMTFTGRGLASQVGPALGATLAEGLGGLAETCVRVCPTAALAFDGMEESE